MPHRSRLAGFIIDCQDADLEAAGAFWSAALGDRRPPRREGDYVRLDDQSGLHAEVQRVAHPSRVHLDIEADDIAAEVARLERLGATVVDRVRTWTVMEAPTGHRFCVIRAQTAEFGARANRWDEDGRLDAPPPAPVPRDVATDAPRGSHRSRLGVLVVDCRTDDLAAPMSFWSGALGLGFRLDDDPRYAAADVDPDMPHVLLQKVAHPPRVHLDIETDDREAERARLERLGATLVERHPKGFVIMQAPTGHRFCLVVPQRPDFAARAAVWEGTA